MVGDLMDFEITHHSLNLYGLCQLIQNGCERRDA
jgi:Fe2+ or Zn2+ uptake regulation protein